jgi:hypothetical protein
LGQIAGEYEVWLDFGGTDLETPEVAADLRFIVKLPAGNGLVYLPLPFGGDSELRIDPGSDPNLILCGSFRPAEILGTCAVALLPESSSVRLAFRNVPLRVDEAAVGEGLLGVRLPLAEAYREAASRFGNNALLVPRRVLFQIENFDQSAPSSVLEASGSRRVIELTSNGTMPPSVVIYAGHRGAQILLYGMLGVLGLMLGLLGAPRLVTSRTRAVVFGAGSVLLLAGLLIYFFGFLPANMRSSDTTTVVTVGTVCGLLLGILVSASQYLRSNPGKGAR